MKTQCYQLFFYDFFTSHAKNKVLESSFSSQGHQFESSEAERSHLLQQLVDGFVIKVIDSVKAFLSLRGGMLEICAVKVCVKLQREKNERNLRGHQFT